MCFWMGLMVVTSAWWVPYSQVQRGEGGHEVRGKKNFLPPAMLVLGYGILWTTEDEETMERHARTLLTEIHEAPSEGIDAVDAVDTADVDDAEDGAEPDGPANNDADSDSESNDANDGNENSIGGRDQDKYNLAEYGSASENDEELESTPQSTTTKRHLSVKQRRDLKKGKQIADQPTDPASEDDHPSIS